MLVAAIETAGYKPGEDIALALDAATSEFYDGRRLRASSTRAARCRPPRWPRYWAELCRKLPDRLDRGRHGRGRLGRLEDADRAPRRHACSSSATTSSSPTPSACSAASTRASPTRSSIKVNQIGTLTETLDAIAMARERRLHGGHVPPLRRDRGHDHRRPRRRHRLRPDQDRRASRSDRVAKYNQLLRIEEELGSDATLPGPLRLQALTRGCLTDRGASGTRG